QAKRFRRPCVADALRRPGGMAGGGRPRTTHPPPDGLGGGRFPGLRRSAARGGRQGGRSPVVAAALTPDLRGGGAAGRADRARRSAPPSGRRGVRPGCPAGCDGSFRAGGVLPALAVALVPPGGPAGLVLRLPRPPRSPRL